MIAWSTVKGWVHTWIDMINAAFDDAIATLTVSPFDSRITVIDTAMTAVEGVNANNLSDIGIYPA